jgi:hypothetical protein
MKQYSEINEEAMRGKEKRMPIIKRDTKKSGHLE